MCENSNDQEKVYVDLDHIMTKGMTMSGIPGENTYLGVGFIFKTLAFGGPGGVLTLTWYTYMCLPFGRFFAKFGIAIGGFIRDIGAQIT